MSKLSLHISDWVNPDFTYDFIEQTRPPIVKVFGNSGLDDAKIREAHNHSPATVFVGRVYFPDQQVERDERTPVDTVFNYDPLADARGAFAQMQGILAKTAGLVTVWEGYNEVPLDTTAPLTDRELQKARNYNAFTVEMARLMHGAGLQYAAYSFSTGNPVHLELWDLLLDGLRASDYLALHEYIAPNEQWTEFDKSMCNRYRAVHSRLPADARKPILITESGADYFGEHGYKGRISVPAYMALLAGYDAELMRDPYVVGAAIYCYGVDDRKWVTYDIGGDLSRVLREHILQNPTPPLEITPVVPTPAPAPAPVPAPAPTPGLLLLAQVLAVAQEARAALDQGNSSHARDLLKNTVVPWFYASAPAHSEDLANAQAHTSARWFADEAVRRIEADKPDEARQLLDEQVLAWLQSPGPHAIGILSVQAPRRERKKRAPAKRRGPRSLLLSTEPPAATPPKKRPKSRRR